MKILRIVDIAVYTFFCSSIFLLSAGCSRQPVTAGKTVVSTASVHTSTYTDEQRLPLENNDYIKAELENFQTMGAQVVCNSEDVYRIANALYHYRDYHNSFIFDEPFSDGIQNAPVKKLVEIAASQTLHINIYGDEFETLDESHPIKRFYLQQLKNNGAVSLLAYGDDVREKARELFGDGYELPRQNGETILYNEDLDLYYLDAEGVSVYNGYPIVLSVTSDGGQIDADVVIMYYNSITGCWNNEDSSWESSENASAEELASYINTHKNQLPRYRFTLSLGTSNGGKTHDGIGITGFQKL